MCFERKVTEVKNGRHADNGEPAVIVTADKRKIVAGDGFYFGKDDNSLVGPFPSRDSAASQMVAAV